MPGFGRYIVSDCGEVRNQQTGAVIKWHPIPSRAKGLIYWRVGLYRRTGGVLERKMLYVHRVVASAFVPGRTEEKTQVHHIDSDPANNCAWNLMWATPAENTGFITDPYEGVPPYEEVEAPF